MEKIRQRELHQVRKTTNDIYVYTLYSRLIQGLSWGCPEPKKFHRSVVARMANADDNTSPGQPYLPSVNPSKTRAQHVYLEKYSRVREFSPERYCCCCCCCCACAPEREIQGARRPQHAARGGGPSNGGDFVFRRQYAWFVGARGRVRSPVQ